MNGLKQYRMKIMANMVPPPYQTGRCKEADEK